MSRLLYVLLLLLSWPSFAQQYPDPSSPPRLVNDFAHVLNGSEAAQLEQKLVAYNDSTSTEITLVTIPTLDGDDVAHYAYNLAERWKVGKHGKNNGILVLAAIQEHKINISVGRGLEGVVTDAVSARIIRNQMAPAFRRNDYYTGFDSATSLLIRAAKGEFKADPKEERRGISPGGIFLIILVILFLIFRRRGGGGGGNYMSRGGWGAFYGLSALSGLGDGGGRSGGGGGGFGGFGGGSFGGGGASGDW